MKLKRILALCLCLTLLAAPVFATEIQPETLPPIYVGVKKLEEMPGSWNPLEPRTDAQEAILRLTAEPLYRLGSDGQIEAAQAAALPLDVTAEFAGQYGIPKDARRGYAFALSVRQGACWENGSAVSVADWSFTVEKMLEQGTFPLEIANYEAVLRGDTRPATEVRSLLDAGYGSVAEAESAGYKDFYLDTTWYWGLDAGWLRITDRTRLFDAAIPSGCEEMYVTPAYLYRQYLGEGGKEVQFQSEFIGIPVQAGEAMTGEDVGLIAGDDRLVLVLQEPAAASTVALRLCDLYPVPRSVYGADYGTGSNYLSCGPYRIVSVAAEEILLEPNPCWLLEPVEFVTVRCIADS